MTQEYVDRSRHPESVYRRLEIRRRKRLNDQPSDDAEDVANTRRDTGARLDIETALARLPDGYRQIIVYRYCEARSFEDIAQRMNRSPNAARKLWSRAIERLQTELND